MTGEICTSYLINTPASVGRFFCRHTPSLQLLVDALFSLSLWEAVGFWIRKLSHQVRLRVSPAFKSLKFV